MEIIITQWALDAYLDLSHKNVFSPEDFQSKLQPDVKLLKNYPKHPKFNNGKFWSRASFGGRVIESGFKMKWHQVGSGKVQLRLPIALTEAAFLCEGYLKSNDKVDRRKLAKFKTHLHLIQECKYKACGVIQ